MEEGWQMENRIKVKIKQCYDTEENYKTNNPVLLAGQLAYTRDKYGEYKIGDGTHSWNELEYVKNYFIGTKAEYTEANDAGLIRPGMIICITDDNDYCNIPVDDEMDETSEHVVLNNTITKYVNTHDLKDNKVSYITASVDGSVPFAGAKGLQSGEGLGDFLKQSRSGFYTISVGNVWYNVISNRHRNGAGDGTDYGLYLLSNLTTPTSDLAWDRQSTHGWQGQRTILDSINHNSYPDNRITNNGIQTDVASGTACPIQSGLTHTSGLFMTMVHNNTTTTPCKYGNMVNLAGYGSGQLLCEWSGTDNGDGHLYYRNHRDQNNNSAGWSRWLTILDSINYTNWCMGEKFANGYWGLAPNGDASQWCRTTNQGIIPYQGGNRGGGHQYLGTSTWYFAQSYIDHMYAVDLNLSSNIVSSLTTSTWLAGNKGTAIINSTAAGSSYNCLFKMNSPNGVFTASSYSGEFGLQYTANSVINANNNSTTKRAVLLNESGNSSFPGQVSAANFSAGGSSAFTTATITNLTVNGSMRLKNSSNYGMKLNFGDGDYVYLYEDVDDHFIIHASKGIKLDGTVETSYIRNPNAASSGSIYQTNVGALQINSGDIQLGVYNGSNKSFKSDIDIQMEFMQNYIYPNDNTYLLGGSSNRWQQIYAVTSGIITSDKREKKEISYISSESEFDETKMDKEKFLEFMTGIKPVIFKRIDGTNNRPHHGIIAQDFEELLQELGIDHAAFIKSPETEKIEEKDENGNIINAYEKPKENCDYRYGMRYEELVSDNIKFSQITYEEVQELKEENTMLKENLSALEKKVSLLLNNL